MIRRALLAAVLAVTLVTTAACGSDDSAKKSGSPAKQSAGLSIDDAWVKAADSGMTAAFGKLKNASAKPITIVSASTSAAGMSQLHETVTTSSGEKAMQEKKGGFVVPANGTLTLEPGGNHIMLMDLKAPVKAGDEVTFTLTLKDGSTFDFTATAKDFAGADEHYES